MSLLLTVYNSPEWKTFVSASGLALINEDTPVLNANAAVLLPTQSLTTVSALLSGSSDDQKLCLAVVQAECFLANAIENGKTLEETAQIWQQQTNLLLGLQRKQRKKLQLFNLHQALAQPGKFRALLRPDIVIKEYAEQPIGSSLALMAACQYLSQHTELQELNTRLQATVLPLCDSEKIALNVDQILTQNNTPSGYANDSDLTSEQLLQTQEQLQENLAHSTAEILAVKAERDQLQQHVDKITAECRDAKQMYSKLESSSEAISEERDLILAQLQQVQEQLEQYYLLLQTEQQNNKHALLARDKQQAKEVAKLDAELRKTKARAANAEYAGQLLQKELEALRKSISWKAAKPVRVLGRLIRKKDPTRDKLMQEVGLLLTSDYFDVNWYLRAYTDVAESQINPAEHYLLHGAEEGRLPGPLFDGNWYRKHYPDVAEANINPLLHFILYGQQEGRSSSPILLTNSGMETEE